MFHPRRPAPDEVARRSSRVEVHRGRRRVADEYVRHAALEREVGLELPDMGADDTVARPVDALTLDRAVSFDRAARAARRSGSSAVT